MTKDTDLSNAWLEAYLLKQSGKRVNLAGGKPLDEALEERMFEEAEERIDADIAKKKGLVTQVVTESPWEKEWKETEHIIFDAKDFKKAR